MGEKNRSSQGVKMWKTEIKNGKGTKRKDREFRMKKLVWDEE